MVKFLDLHHQYTTIKDDIDRAIAAVIHDAAFIHGKYARQFEEHFAAYLHVKHCIGVGNGTDALEIAIEALDLPPESEIIVPANSFIASAEAVSRTGHHVVFCDCQPENYTLSTEDLSRKLSEKTKAVIAVHLYGHPVDMDALHTLCQPRHIRIIEDCAQAHGAEYKGTRVGTLGDIGTFSFYPGKNLGAYGDAGAIVTNDEALARRCRMIANHGRITKYDHEFEGRNSRLDGLQAAILSAKLPHLDRWIAARRAIAQQYRDMLREVKGIITPHEEAWAKHAYHLFVIRAEQRDHLQEYLKQHEIQTGIHYPIALPKLQAYRHLHQTTSTVMANQFDSQILSLPIGEHLSQENVEFVVQKLQAFYSR